MEETKKLNSRQSDFAETMAVIDHVILTKVGAKLVNEKTGFGKILQQKKTALIHKKANAIAAIARRKTGRLCPKSYW